MKVVIVPTRWDVHVTAITCSVALFTAGFGWWLRMKSAASLEAVALITGICGLVIAWCVWSTLAVDRAYARQARELRAKPSVQADGQSFGSAWLDDNRIYRRVAGPSSPEKREATLIIYGLAPFVPQGAEYTREPEVGSVAGPNIATLVFVCTLPVVLWTLQMFASRTPQTRVLSNILLVLSPLFTLAYALKAFVESRRFLRVSPGLIEIFKLPLFRGPPEVRSYPCSPGTVVILRMLVPSCDEKSLGLVHGIRPMLSVIQGDQHDRIPLSRFDIGEVLRMLTSTRPIPPDILTKDALIG